MAQKVILVDDLDGSEGSQTVTYTVHGQEYEIDLSEKNAQKFRDALAPYIEKSRPVQRQTLVPSPTRAVALGARAAAAVALVVAVTSEIFARGRSRRV